MQLRAEQLSQHIAQAAQRGGLKKIYTLHGDEPLLAQEAADQLRAAARAAGFAERQVFVVSGAHFDWSGVLGAAQSMGLFCSQQLIEIRIPSGKPGKEGGLALVQFAESAPQDVLTIVHLPRLDRQQMQSAWFLALDNAGISIRLDPVERHQLPGWIAQRLKAQGQRVSEGEAGEHTLAFFADKVEGNLLAAHQELQKLALLYPAGELSYEQVESAVLNVARYSLAQLSVAVLNGQIGRALRILEGLKAEGEAAVLVHWTLAEDIRALKRGADALAAGKPLPMALREAKVWGERERLVERLLPGLPAASLVGLQSAAAQCDGLVKGLRHPDWPSDAWDGLRLLALRLMDAVRSTQAPRGRGSASPRRLALRA